jgi:hypothetical protein
VLISMISLPDGVARAASASSDSRTLPSLFGGLRQLDRAVFQDLPPRCMRQPHDCRVGFIPETLNAISESPGRE